MQRINSILFSHYAKIKEEWLNCGACPHHLPSTSSAAETSMSDCTAAAEAAESASDAEQAASLLGATCRRPQHSSAVFTATTISIDCDDGDDDDEGEEADGGAAAGTESYKSHLQHYRHQRHHPNWASTTSAPTTLLSPSTAATPSPTHHPNHQQQNQQHARNSSRKGGSASNLLFTRSASGGAGGGGTGGSSTSSVAAAAAAAVGFAASSSCHQLRRLQQHVHGRLQRQGNFEDDARACIVDGEELDNYFGDGDGDGGALFAKRREINDNHKFKFGSWNHKQNKKKDKQKESSFSAPVLTTTNNNNFRQNPETSIQGSSPCDFQKAPTTPSPKDSKINARQSTVNNNSITEDPLVRRSELKQTDNIGIPEKKDNLDTFLSNKPSSSPAKDNSSSDSTTSPGSNSSSSSGRNNNRRCDGVRNAVMDILGALCPFCSTCSCRGEEVSSWLHGARVEPSTSCS